ncbi:hypothetical protein D3C78_1873100 [compost metagenome]
MVRSKIRTLASTAMPTPRTIAAIPGSVSVNSAKLKTTISSHVCRIKPKLASRPGTRYNQIMKTNMNKEATKPAWIV